MKTANLPQELIDRIQKEAVENDIIYGTRSRELLDLSKIHYGHREMLDWALLQLPDKRGSRILDIGVGDGYSSVLLATRGAQVTGIEVSIEALKRAAALAEQHGLEIEFRQMAGEQLDFGDSTFDGILCMSAFHHMDLDRASKEFARVLRPRGRLVLVEPLASNPPAWIYRRIGGVFSREATSKETPLRVQDLNFLHRHFRKVEWRGMYMLCLVPFGVDRMWNKSNPFVHRVTKRLFKWLSPIDSGLLRVPGLQRLAWKIAIVAER